MSASLPATVLVPGSKKSTTGRKRNASSIAMRVGFAVLARVAPRVAERRAAMLFMTPRRRRAAGALAHAAAREFVVDAAGFRLTTWTWGDGPHALLVHGWSGAAADMVAIADALAGAGFRVTVVDMPAHGRSPGHRTSLVEWIAALGAVGEELGPFHTVVGHSLGAAAVTLALAEAFPADRAVLVAPPSNPMLYLDRIRRFLGLPAHRAEGMIRAVVRHVGREPAELDAARAARSLRLPALILHDPADAEVPWEQGRAIADAWRGSALVARPGAGHTRILRDPDALDEIVEFVGAR